MADSAAFNKVIMDSMQRVSPTGAKAQHVTTARAGLADFLSTLPARPKVRIETDGHAAASEDEVQPFGIITYELQRLDEIATFALETARELSPVESGEYRNSWILLADGKEVDAAEILVDAAEITLVNDVPYARKIEVRGAGLVGVPPGIVERVKEIVQNRFGARVIVRIEYITLASGYQLKRPRQSGSVERYPALIITARN